MGEYEATGADDSVRDDWADGWHRNKTGERKLYDLAGAVGQLPGHPLTPEGLDRIFEIIASMRGLELDEVYRMVDESRELRGRRHGPTYADEVRWPGWP